MTVVDNVLTYCYQPDKSNKADKPERPSQYNHSRPKERQYKRKRNFGISDREIPGIIEFLGVTVKQTLPFKELYSQARSTDRLNIQLPEEFPKAWLYLLICFASSTKDMMVYETQSFVVQDLLDKGMRKVVQGTAKKSLLESLVFTPFELATLINFQLLEGATAYSQDIIEPYWQYLRGLVSHRPYLNTYLTYFANSLLRKPTLQPTPSTAATKTESHSCSKKST